MRFSVLFESKCMSSKHSVMLDAKISTSTNHSKAGVSTTEHTAVRAFVQCMPHLVSTNFCQQGHLRTLTVTAHRIKNQRLVISIKRTHFRTSRSIAAENSRPVHGAAFFGQNLEMTLDPRRDLWNFVVHLRLDRPHKILNNARDDRIM